MIQATGGVLSILAGFHLAILVEGFVFLFVATHAVRFTNVCKEI